METDKENIKKTFARAAELFKPRLDPTKINMLYSRWNYPKKTIKQIFDYFETDVEASDTYLDIMNAIAESKNPADAWEYWCESTGASHEIENNPFIK